MKKFTIAEVALAVNGRLVQGDQYQIVANVSIDTRSLRSGDLFVALKGENFDAHDYVRQAVASGAAALMLSKPVAGLDDLANDLPVIMVANTLTALQKLAAYNRRQFDIPVIGVTGSNGKTTTKDLIYTILSKKYPVLKTKGNFNNEIGLPLTLLKLNADYQAVVLEMGMRGPGQIDHLCAIAGINAAVITNIGEAHLELLGSVENIAMAKGEILDHVPPGGFALIPAENELAKRQAPRCQGAIATFGINERGNDNADYVAIDIKTGQAGSKFIAVTPVGKITVQLPLPGKHNIANAMAALAVGVKMGLPLAEIAAALAGAEISAMRLQILQIGAITIINDAYNANPVATKAALDTLADLAKDRRQVAVLGSMFELGSREQQGHYETGLAALNVDLLLTVGALATQIAVGAKAAGLTSDLIHRCADNNAAISCLKNNLLPGDVVLVKGSRGMQMEEIITGLKLG